MLRKVIASAMANAVENNNAEPSSLRIAEVKVDAGPRYKRIIARAMGRANRIEKRTAHITVVVEDSFEKNEIKPHGTKAKPRPKLAEAGGRRKKAEPVKAKDEAVAVAPVTEEAEVKESSVTEEAIADEPAAEETTENVTAEEGPEEKKD